MPVIRHDLTLDEKMSLIKDRDNGMAYRILVEKYKISLGAVTNIIKRRGEYIGDYERNQNKALFITIFTKNKDFYLRFKTNENHLYFIGAKTNVMHKK